MPERRVEPRTFFLNETHEHARDDRDGGGRVAEFSSVNWGAKGDALAKSLRVARRTVEQSPDPLRQTRLFLLSRPELRLERVSKAKTAKHGKLESTTSFAGKDARLFQSLGMDLLRVTAHGDAVVHATSATVEQMESTASQLGSAGKRERSRWVHFAQFQAVPAELRVDPTWLANVNDDTTNEVIIDMQPVLTRQEFDLVFGAIRELMSKDTDERVIVGGRSVSGRRWLRAHLRRETIQELASGFQSIQSIHPPLRSIPLAATTGRRATTVSSNKGPSVAVGDLPVVAMVDAGVPREHASLAAYRRGEFRHPEVAHTNPGDHGSHVASRIVFGEVDAGQPGFVPPPGRCRFLDVVVPISSDEFDRPGFDDLSVMQALSDVARNYPDVRVVNLSIGGLVPLAKLDEQQQFARYEQLQDLDILAFEHDLVVVVAAGNTPPGMIPNNDYPGHLDEADWGLCGWAAGFNTLVAGAYVEQANADGVARFLGWPSPFTRVGPGVANAPVPNFSAGGGDGTKDYQWTKGRNLGVWVLNQVGQWEDGVGTSLAAPIVAREATLVRHALQRHCGPGILPFAATVKAFMALVARHVCPGGHPGTVESLAERTLGRGRPSHDRLLSPSSRSAVFMWQGTLERVGHIARIQLPVPRQWLARAESPRLRVVCAWNTPAFAGAKDVWACRRVSLQLRATLGGKALRTRGVGVGAYPLIDRTYDLTAAHLKAVEIAPKADDWVLELDYAEVAPYPPGLRVDDQQRVGVVVELFDESDIESPQAHVQALPAAHTMIHLGGLKQPVWAPIRILT
jgi:hypothetical protein